MNALRALIVDDEPLARERLGGMLRRESSVEIVGECVNGLEAIAAIKGTSLDLVFLDMQMPGCDGLQVLAEIPPERRPGIIFVTAHERYALDAFEVQAIDYLLKPFDRERLQTALQRARVQLQLRPAVESGIKGETVLMETAAAENKNERLTVKVDGRIVFLRSDDIVWVEADDNYVILHLVSGQLMLRETMTAFANRLNPAKFTRINRSALVHLDWVRELQPTLHGDYHVFLRDGTKLPLSRSQRGQLIKFAGI